MLNIRGKINKSFSYTYAQYSNLNLKLIMSQNGTKSNNTPSIEDITNSATRRKHHASYDRADDEIFTSKPTSPNKVLKSNPASYFTDFENVSSNDLSFPEVFTKLNSLFDLLKERYSDNKEVFESLSKTLNTYNGGLTPIPIEKSRYFVNQPAPSFISPLLTKENISSISINEAKANCDIKSQITPIVKSFQPLIPSSPIKRETNPFVLQSRHLHLATQANINSPISTVVQAPKHVKTITLSREQEMVAELARLGKNIFYTGSAGTGKSLLLKTLIKNLKAQHPNDLICITASTGLAAYNIGGMTINSCAGIGLGTGSVPDLCRKIRGNKKAKERWDKMKVLIIDEISMIDGRLIDKLDKIARRVKNPDSPFGGVQVIFCGDFYQLPPVSKERDTVFAFESEFWRKHIEVQVILKQVFRQASDKQFLQMLQEIRDGKVTESTTTKFKSLERPLPPMDNLIPTRLFSTRREVDIANNDMLKKLKGNGITFQSIDSGSMINSPQAPKMLENFLAPKSITLKPGAQVMMLKNIDETLVNGSLGTIVGFIDPSTYMIYNRYCASLEEDNNTSLLPRLQQLIREPQDDLEGSIFDFLLNAKYDDEKPANQQSNNENETDPSIMELNVTTSEDLDYVMSTQPIDENGDAAQMERVLRNSNSTKDTLLSALNASSSGRKLPLVCFRLSNGESRTVAVETESFTIEDTQGNALLSREQLPLMLAWALSIHKSQGQTLKYVSVDLKRVFEDGQAYVALSRAEHRRGLQVLNFNPTKISTNRKVIDFYKNLSDAETVLNNINNNKPGKVLYSSSFTDNPGMKTQVENLDRLTASPERFQKYQKDKSRAISIDLMLRNKNDRKKARIEIPKDQDLQRSESTQNKKPIQVKAVKNTHGNNLVKNEIPAVSVHSAHYFDYEADVDADEWKEMFNS